VPERAERQVEDWQAWADRCPAEVPHRDAVVRSLVTLRLMSHADTGGIVAAPTTSLPEEIGGERNWDYRFCWLRDAALTLESLLTAGYTDEARSWRRWLLRAAAGEPGDLQIMYAVDGGRELPERELDHLPGYEGSTPVRVGNGAVGQRQLDVLGEVMIALDQARECGIHENRSSWRLQRAMLDQLVADVDCPDHGLWEIRGPQQYFTHSRVMAWAALDRGLCGIERHGLDGPADDWRACRDALREEIETRAFDTDRGTFVQHRDTREVDAALLVLPAVGFVAGDDPRMLGTIRAVEEDLMHDGLLVRYRTESGVDGIDCGESPFLACSFWLVSAYAAAGRREDAEALMERLVGLANDVGLLAEEYDPRAGRMLGNFPQAFSHLALVRAAFDLR
jgi:GH15 family glucan-1,4-alpha-glucosidase